MGCVIIFGNIGSVWVGEDAIEEVSGETGYDGDGQQPGDESGGIHSGYI